MTTDFRALCVELTDCLEKADWPPRYKVVFQQWTDIAHAALAEADGPAVPQGREPASVTPEASPSDHIALRLQRLEAMRETEKAALLDAFRQIDELKQRIDWQYIKIHRLEDAIAAELEGTDV